MASEALAPLTAECVVSLSRLERGAPVEAVTHCAFDPAEECVWAGTDGGSLAVFSLPELSRYCCASGAHPSPLAALLPLGGAAFSASARALRVHSSGGVVRLALDEDELMPDGADTSDESLTCAAFESAAAPRVVLGRAAPFLQTFDLATGRYGPRVDAPDGACCVASSGRSLAFGSLNGRVSLRDPRARLREEASLAAHSGAVFALDARGELLVSAGMAPRRGGGFGPEAVVKVWDVRAAPRPLAQLPFPGGPAALRFLPRFSSTLLVASPQGFFSLLDAVGGGAAAATHAVHTGGAALLCAAVGDAGEAVVLGDAGGYLHLFGTHDEPRGSLYGTPLEAPVLRAAPRSSREPPGELLFVPPSFDAAFGDGTAPLSALPPGLLRVGAPPRALDAALARDVKTVDFVGYVANPAYRRGLPRGAAAAAVAPLRNARVARRRDAADRAAAVGAGAGRRRPAAASPLPAAYLYTEARAAHAASAPRAAFDYDFSAFNATRLAGLENDLADAYVNPLLQALLRGAPHLRTALLRHVCDREFCARCELGFLAHALARQPPGGAARPANLLRALRQIREAGALGLLEGTDEPGARPDACLPRRVQALARFLLEQLAKEETAAAQAAPKDSGQAAVERLFGAQVCTTTTCAQCGAAAAREARSLAFDLAYASAAQGGQARPSFAAVLAASLGGAPTEVRAWCAAERAYARAASERRLRALPACLLLCCGMKDTADLRWWGVADAALRAADAAQRRAASGAADDAASYEAAETAPTLERWLPHAVRVALLASGGVAVTQADSPAQLGPRGAHAAAGESAAAVYRLMAVVARVRPRSGEAEPTGASGAEAAQRAEGHLVAHVRVTPPDVPRRGAFLRGSDADDAAPAATPGVSPLPAPGAGLAARAAAQAPPPPRPSTPEAPEATPADAPLPDAPTPRTPARPEGLAAAAPAESPGREASSAEGVSDWVLFNDFAVTPTAACEPAQLYGAAKQPCLLLFQRLEAGEAAEPPALAPPAPAAPSPLTEALYARLLRARPPPPGASYRPLDLASEAPRAGMLVGIDAEFVALSAAETSVRPDGSAAVLRPARLGLARVSVVRGAGPSAGVTLQDDYVRPVEAVHDYLTRYSGLQPADLDPAAARHGGNVTTLKAAYLKLRYLADAGCVFCGHGLLSDFRCLNMAVPATQIVDTVELFHFKRQRKLGLRFLARFLLGAHIQRGSHDSVEDARTALALYAKYLRLQRRGTLQATLLELYRFGKTHGWDGNAPDAVWPPVQPDDDEPPAAV